MTEESQTKDYTTILKDQVTILESYLARDPTTNTAISHHDITERICNQIQTNKAKREEIEYHNSEITKLICSKSTEVDSWLTVYKKAKRDKEIAEKNLESEKAKKESVIRNNTNVSLYLLTNENRVEIERKIADLQNFLNENETQCQKLLEEYNTLRFEYKRSEEELNFLTNENKNVNDELEQLTQQLASYQEAFNGIIDVATSLRSNKIVNSICEVLVHYNLHKKGADLNFDKNAAMEEHKKEMKVLRLGLRKRSKDVESPIKVSSSREYPKTDLSLIDDSKNKKKIKKKGKESE